MNREDWIGAYLAGALRGDKLKDFEAQLKIDPTLQTEVEAVKSFANTIDDTQDFPEVLEMIKEADNASRKQWSFGGNAKVLPAVIGIVLLTLFLLFIMDNPSKESPVNSEPVINQEVYATNFNDFINKKYNDNTQFLSRNINRGGGPVLVDSQRLILFEEVNVFASEGNWTAVDRLLSKKIEKDTLTNYEKDAINFIAGLARLQIDSCDALGKTRLLAIPKREFYNFFPVSQEILDRVERTGCHGTPEN